MRLHLADLYYLAPELAILITAVLLSLIDLFMPRNVSRTVLAWLSLAGIAVSALFVVHFIGVLNPSGGDAIEPIQLLNHSYRVDDFANLFKLLILAGSALVIFMSISSLKEEQIYHRGEYYYLFLPAILGAMIMSSSGDLITLFVGMELLSITSYILVALRKMNKQANEAAFKYVVTGSIATAFTLYGMSFLYGMSGSTNIGEINRALSALDPSFSAMIYISFFLMLVGFGFKIAAAPFHTWAPDVYQGAATPVAAFLSVVSKSAAFAILFRVVYNVYFLGPETAGMPIHSDVFLALLVLAAAAMILGNAMALRQMNMRRLLAYSGIANAGYLLVPLGIQLNGMHSSNFSELFFYLIAYYFMNLGIFAVLMVVSRAAGHEEMSGFAGLYHRKPGLAIATLILVLSLAGIPFTGGFFGKLYILLGTVRVQEYWLALVMMLTSVVSFYYYFSILRQIFMRPGHGLQEIRPTTTLSITIWICAALSLLLGLFPQWVLTSIERIFRLSTDFFIF
jgi:NADH-quinone oxidoreductase subunit N